jgi:hypothetical protein
MGAAMVVRGVWAALAFTSVLAVAGCTAGGATPPASGPTADGVAAAPSGSTVPGGCGGTPIRVGPAPDWAVGAVVMTGRYVMSAEGNLIGVFGQLRAGHPEDPANKVLWVVREPRGGAPLRLTLRPAEATAPQVTVEQPANSWPGEIYPSIVDVPTPGCWQVVAEWNGNRATLDLLYG